MALSMHLRNKNKESSIDPPTHFSNDLLLVLLASGWGQDVQMALGVAAHLHLAAVHVLGDRELPPEAARDPDAVFLSVVVRGDGDDVTLTFDVNVVGLEHRQVEVLAEVPPGLGHLHILLLALGNGGNVLDFYFCLLLLLARDEWRLHHVMVVMVHEAVQLALVHPRGNPEGAGSLPNVAIIVVPPLVTSLDPHLAITHRHLHLVRVEPVQAE